MRNIIFLLAFLVAGCGHWAEPLPTPTHPRDEPTVNFVPEREILYSRTIPDYPSSRAVVWVTTRGVLRQPEWRRVPDGLQRQPAMPQP